MTRDAPRLLLFLSLLLFQSARAWELCSSHPKYARYLFRTWWAVAMLHDRSGSDERALAAVDKALAVQPERVEALSLKCKLLFRMHAYDRGMEVLRSTLNNNNCMARMAVDLVERCCGYLDVDGAGGEEQQQQFNMLVQAYEALTARFTGDEKVDADHTCHTCPRNRWCCAGLG